MTGAVPRNVVVEDTLLQRSPFVGVFVQGLPLALGLASHALINLVDLLLVGRLGPGAIQAAHVASTWNFLPMIVGNCVSTALLARLSRALGAGDLLGARQLHVRAQWFMLWLGLALAVATAAPASLQIAATGLVGAVGTDAVHYLVVSNVGCLPMFALMQTTAAMRAAGEVWVPLALLLLANLLNLVLDLILLFGWDAFGVPAVGVAGAAYASAISRALAAWLALLWLRRRSHVLSLRAVPVAAPALPVGRPLLHDAWPQVVQISLRAGLVLALTIVVQRQFGGEATASIGITSRLDTLVLFASLGFANAATAYAGRAVVLGRAGAARAAGFWAGLQAGCFGALVVLALQSGSRAIARWFLPAASPATVAATDLYLHTAAWSQVLGAVALGAIGAVHGAGRMVAPMLVDLIGFAAAGALLAAAAASDGLEGVYLSLVAGAGLVAALQLGFVAVGRWARLR